jgi:hypothetical protein
MDHPDHALKILLRRYAASSWRDEISSGTRLFHDLLITGDNVLEFWREFDPNSEIKVDDFNIDEFFPSELSWDALAIRLYARFGLHQRILQRYKELTVQDILDLKKGKAWSEIRRNR